MSGIETPSPAALILVVLPALAARLSIRVGPRTRISTFGAFVVAAALVGGPLLGACAGASAGGFGDRRRRATGVVVGALQGIVVGVVGERIAQSGAAGAVAAAVAGLASGFALYAASAVVLA